MDGIFIRRKDSRVSLRFHEAVCLKRGPLWNSWCGEEEIVVGVKTSVLSELVDLVLRDLMGRVCQVIAGKWVTGINEEWEFMIDKRKMGRLINILDGWSFEDICKGVYDAFRESEMVASFSYWDMSYDSSGFCRKMPPTIIDSDSGVANFVKLLIEKVERNLLVTFTVSEESCFKTPGSSCVKRKSVGEGGCSNSGIFVGGSQRQSGIPRTPNLGGKEISFDESPCSGGMEDVGMRTPVSAFDRKRGFDEGGSSSGGLEFAAGKRRSSIPRPPVIVDEVGLVEEVEAIEEMERVKSIDRMNSTKPSFNLFEDDDMSECSEFEVAEEDVKLGGYDNEFWRPLVDDIFGWSNAVEVLCGRESVLDRGLNSETGFGNENPDAMNPEPNSASRGKGPMGADTNSDFRGKAPIGGTSLRREVPPVLRRNLKDICDEEFDVEPLFNDTTYDKTEIPDLDRDENHDEIYVGKTFRNKLDCQICLAIHAIKNMFYFKQSRSQKNYIVLNCADTLCGWRVTAYEMKDSCYFQIRKADLQHICSIETRSQFYKLASSKVIAAIYKSKFIGNSSAPRPIDLQQLVLEDLRVSSSYTKCWKAIEAANVENKGSEEDGYLYLLQYLHMLKMANPGTVTEVKTEPDGVGGERFLYLFLAFGASIKGFRYVRPVLVLDGAHLGGKYKGVLLTVSGQDANFQVFPLAFAVVDAENEAAWQWFLERVERIIADSPRLAIISDRAPSILKAVKTVFPQAKHGVCIVHLARNVVSKFKSKGLAQLVIRAGCAYKVKEFDVFFSEIMKRSLGCCSYLRECGIPNWSRLYFGGNRYNLMTTNIAESLNSALRNGRNSPITELVMFIQAMLTRWFSARRKKAELHCGAVSPQVDKVITNNLSHAKGSRVINICPWRYEVVGQFGVRHNVDLKDKQCSCRVYDELKIPCAHALIACGDMGLCYGQASGDFYRTDYWRKTYEGIIQSHEDPREGDIPEEVYRRVIMPPRTRRPSGRPTQRRIPSIGEFGSGSGSKGGANRCGRCRGLGHNKSSCKNPI